jgi:two-component system, OmpR family, response regulator
MARILLIEDDVSIAEEIQLELRRREYEITWSRGGVEAWELAHEPFDAMIVDRLLPGRLESLDLIAELRAKGVQTPMLVVSALACLDDRVRGLRAGADDYLPKPFALIELIARLEALLRRPAAIRETRLRFGSLDLDLLARQARRGNRELDLLTREMDILAYLVRHRGRVVTRSMLLQGVWGYRFEPRSNVVHVHMSNLRRKVDLPHERPLICNVRGIGYRIDEPR